MLTSASPEPTCWLGAQRLVPLRCTGWSFRVSEDGSLWWLWPERWGLLFSLLASISHLFPLRSVAVPLSFSVPLRSRTHVSLYIRSPFLFPFPLRSASTCIHTHVYSHSNQLRRLFFGARHASLCLFAASPALGEASQRPHTRWHYYFSAPFAYRTLLCAAAAASICILLGTRIGGQHDVSLPVVLMVW